MIDLRVHARLFSWVAIFAILLAALAPSVSYAVGSADGVSSIDVCTSQGSKWIQVGENGPEPASEHLLDHCLYCSLHTPTLGLPPAAPTALLTSRQAHEVPLGFLGAPRTLHAWVSAQPRAPPRAF